MSKIKKEDLLPCPYCGKTNEHFHHYSRRIGFDVFYCIRCYCGAETNDWVENGAAQRWNSRAGHDFVVVGYMTPRGFYPTKLEAVSNGEQSVEPVYRVKK